MLRSVIIRDTHPISPLILISKLLLAGIEILLDVFYRIMYIGMDISLKMSTETLTVEGEFAAFLTSS